MKKIFFLLLFSVSIGFVDAQKTDYTVSFDGIGQLRLGMSKAELEKLLKIKIILKHIGVDQVYVETIQAKYLGKDVSLYLFRSEEKIAVLESVTVTDPEFKTVDGIGIGTVQSTIVDKFEDHLLIIHPEYAEDGSLKNRTIIKLASMDNLHAAIIFTLVNNKVVSIEVGPTPEFRDRE